MARAAYIWIVFDAFGQLSSAFTVKHEMVAHLRRQPDTEGWVVVRRRSCNGEQTSVNAVELLESVK